MKDYFMTALLDSENREVDRFSDFYFRACFKIEYNNFHTLQHI